MDQQICIICKELKTKDEFYKSKNGNLYLRCKSCEAKRCKEYKARTSYSPSEKRNTKEKQQRHELLIKNIKVCSSCRIEKSSTEFEVKRFQCKECRDKYIKMYHARPEIKEHVNTYFKQRNKANPELKVLSRLRARLNFT